LSISTAASIASVFISLLK